MLLVVFRPAQLPDRGFLYGWNISNDTICIAGALALSSREHAIDILAKVLSKHDTPLNGDLDNKPQILGYIAEHNELILDHQFVGRRLFINYCPPNTRRMQFFSLEPLELDITPNLSDSDSTEAFGRAPSFQKLSAGSQKWIHISLPISLQYLNRAHELRRIVAARQDGYSLPLWVHTSNTHIKRLLNTTNNRIVTISQDHWSPLSFFYSFWNKSLKDSSAFIQQLDARKDLLLFIFKQFCTFEKREMDDLRFASIQYISLYNCIWLTFNDIIIGTACGIFLIENQELLGFKLYKIINKVIIIYIRSTVAWLDNWPAGLKLNTELSRALFHFFIQITSVMEAILERIAPYFPTLFQFAGFMGRFGVTMSLALCSDYLTILTGHLYMLHLVTALMFSQLKSMSGSLWNLFRGKRFNVLRQRNDFWEYDVDQLLLGTILMTLIVFVFPTVLMYYLLFALARFGIMVLHAVLDTCLALLNHFPLFALMLRIKDPHRLPGGVQFKTVTIDDSLYIKNQLIPLSKIFFQHIAIWSRLSSHYDPRRLLACILTGVPMVQLARENIRYAFIGRRPEKYGRNA